ncbi:hypothetical protein [Candidatus Similichlamydia laticola]|uniref:Uncharacterized protein n=1 Tax=Candidatus Similichlamydia laticola TaxID=2170265 RepID=A0A369KFK5_9BACT|nr:hypothetical protein [Candidatus Similichlamydia laticola]RDB31687.1 hypothetical protein HAT2_00196 [Candidatus Similichlamydia laticola]
MFQHFTLSSSVRQACLYSLSACVQFSTGRRAGVIGRVNAIVTSFFVVLAAMLALAKSLFPVASSNVYLVLFTKRVCAVADLIHLLTALFVLLVVCQPPFQPIQMTVCLFLWALALLFTSLRGLDLNRLLKWIEEHSQQVGMTSFCNSLVDTLALGCGLMCLPALTSSLISWPTLMQPLLYTFPS